MCGVGGLSSGQDRREARLRTHRLLIVFTHTACLVPAFQVTMGNNKFIDMGNNNVK